MAGSQPKSQAQRSRGRWWLLGAAVLLVAAALLMFYGEKEAPPPAHAEVNMPVRMRTEERERLEKRRTLPEVAAPIVAGQKGPERPRDPVLAALARPGLHSAVVIEANAIRYSPVGQLMIDCLTSDPERNPFERIKERAGVDVLQDVDRVAVTEDGFVVSGNFDKARWDDVFQDGRERYGDSATLYDLPTRKRADGSPIADSAQPAKDPGMIGTWNNQMLFLSDSPQAAKDTVDRLEGRAPTAEPLIGENQTYGEIYGVVSAELLAKMLPSSEATLAARLREAADRIELHVDTSKDVGVVAQIRGPDASQVEDLGKSLGGALALARIQAQANGDQEAAQLLEMAKVVPNDGHFRLEMAMPLPWLEQQLRKCKEDNLAKARRREAEGDRAATTAGEPETNDDAEGAAAAPATDRAPAADHP